MHVVFIALSFSSLSSEKMAAANTDSKGKPATTTATAAECAKCREQQVYSGEVIRQVAQWYADREKEAVERATIAEARYRSVLNVVQVYFDWIQTNRPTDRSNIVAIAQASRNLLAVVEAAAAATPAMTENTLT